MDALRIGEPRLVKNPLILIDDGQIELLKKRCRMPPAGELGVSPGFFIIPPRLGDTGG
jgi:hypothetical protein